MHLLIILIAANIRIDNGDKLRCPRISAVDRENVEPQEQMAPLTDNVVVRAVPLYNTTGTITTLSLLIQSLLRQALIQVRLWCLPRQLQQ
jgi:hypothetical protein